MVHFNGIFIEPFSKKIVEVFASHACMFGYADVVMLNSWMPESQELFSRSVNTLRELKYFI